MLLAAFEPASKELAIFYIIAVACFVVAAFAGTTVPQRSQVRVLFMALAMFAPILSVTTGKGR